MIANVEKNKIMVLCSHENGPRGGYMNGNDEYKGLYEKLVKVFGQEFMSRDTMERHQVFLMVDHALKNRKPDDITELQVEGFWEIMNGDLDHLVFGYYARGEERFAGYRKNTKNEDE